MIKAKLPASVERTAGLHEYGPLSLRRNILSLFAALFLFAETQMKKVYHPLFKDVSKDEQYTCGKRNDDGDQVLA